MHFGCRSLTLADFWLISESDMNELGSVLTFEQIDLKSR